MTSSVRDIVLAMLGTRDGVRPSIQLFPELEIEQLGRELRLEQQGEEDGRAGNPRVGETGSYRAALDVHRTIEARARKANEDYEAQLALYDGRIRRAVVTTDIRIAIEAAGRNAIADFAARIADEQNHLQLARQEAAERGSEFDAFRTRHGLTRLPTLLTGHQQMLRNLLLVLFVILESTINGLFFAKGSEAGIIGGVVQALVLSLLNVGAAVFYGAFGVPRLHHRSLSRKVVGLVSTLAFSAWLLSLNLAIGHFRDLYTVNSGVVRMADLLARLVTAPFLLADVESGILVLLGIGLGIVTVVDVMWGRETYPGFAEVGRNRRAAIQAFADARTAGLRGLTDLRDQAVAEMTGAIEGLRTAQYDLTTSIAGRAQLHRKFCAYLDHLASSHESLVLKYREANRRARTIEAPPEWSRRVESPPFLAYPDAPPTTGDETGLREQVLDRIERYIEDINLRFEDALKSLQASGSTPLGDLRDASA